MAIKYGPWPKFRWTDSNGDPLSGGKVYTYVANSQTETPTYSDIAGTENANPVILDSRGEADILFSDAITYDIVVKDSDDVTIDTIEDFSIATSASSSLDPIAGRSLLGNTSEIAAVPTAVAIVNDVSSDSSSEIPSANAVKTYVDAAVAAVTVDLDAVNAQRSATPLDLGGSSDRAGVLYATTLNITGEVLATGVQAISSAGGALQNQAGQNCLTWGAGGGQNVSTADGLNVGGALSVTGATTVADLTVSGSLSLSSGIVVPFVQADTTTNKLEFRNYAGDLIATLGTGAFFNNVSFEMDVVVDNQLSADSLIVRDITLRDKDEAITKAYGQIIGYTNSSGRGAINLTGAGTSATGITIGQNGSGAYADAMRLYAADGVFIETARFVYDSRPTLNNTYTFGTSGYRWANVYTQLLNVAGTATFAAINATNLSASGTLSVTGVTTVGNNIVSNTNNTDSLGTSSVRWANVYTTLLNVSGAATMATITGTTITATTGIVTPGLQASSSAGLVINNSSGTLVATFGAGASATLALAGVLTTSNTITSTQGAVTGACFNSLVTGDIVSRFLMTVDGTQGWGPGPTAIDTFLARVGVSTLRISTTVGGAAGGTLEVGAITGTSATFSGALTGTADQSFLWGNLRLRSYANSNANGSIGLASIWTPGASSDVDYGITFLSDETRLNAPTSGKLSFRIANTENGYTNDTGRLYWNGSISISAASAYFLGDPDTDNSWRIIRSGNNLEFQRRESGSWVNKSTITA